MLAGNLTESLQFNQEVLWFITIAIDLGFAIILYRLFGRQGLYASIIISLLLANLQGPKLTEIFGLQTSMGVILYSSIFFATDLLSERYGKQEATRAVMIGFLVSIIIIVMISISLAYLPAKGPETAAIALSMHEATATLFNYTPRFVIGSLLAYLISQRFDVWVFHLIKEKTQGNHLWLRNNVSTVLAQAVDTIIYGLIAWWGVVDLSTAMQLALAKYLFKVLIAVIDTPFIYLARGWDVGSKDWVDESASKI